MKSERIKTCYLNINLAVNPLNFKVALCTTEDKWYVKN